MPDRVMRQKTLSVQLDALLGLVSYLEKRDECTPSRLGAPPSDPIDAWKARVLEAARAELAAAVGNGVASKADALIDLARSVEAHDVGEEDMYVILLNTVVATRAAAEALRVAVSGASTPGEELPPR